MAGEAYRIRILKRDGTEVASDLPHKAPTTFEVIGFQPGSSAPHGNFGRALISLLAPTDPGGIAASIYYSQLDYLYRVEIYAGGLGAQPLWTGIIERLPQDLITYTLEAVDSLSVMTLGITQRQQIINDTADNIARYALKDYALQSGDDFAGTTPLNNYTQHGAAPAWTITTNTAMTGVNITGMASGRRIIENKTNFATSVYQAGAYVDADFIVTASAANTGFAPGLVMGYTDASNYLYADFDIDTTPGAGNVAGGQLRIVKRVAGVETVMISVPVPAGVVAADGTLVVNFQLRFLVSYASPNYTYQAILDGQDFGCIVASTVAPSGPVGVEVQSDAGGGTVFASNLYFLNRQAIFVEQSSPAWPSGTGTSQQKFDQSTLFDVFVTGVQGGGWSFRKEPRAGWNNDILTVAVTPGADTAVVFEEGSNLTSAKLEPNQAKPASAVSGQGKAQASTAVVNIARNLAAINKYGHVMQQTNREDVADYATLRRIAQLAVKLSSSPGQSKTVIVDDALADGQYRELDTAIFNIPSMGFANSRRQVMSKLYTEGSPLATLTLDQYPITKNLNEFKRIQSSIDNLVSASNYVDRTMSLLASAGTNNVGTTTVVTGGNGPPFGPVNVGFSTGYVTLSSATFTLANTTTILMKGIAAGSECLIALGPQIVMGAPIYVQVTGFAASSIGFLQSSVDFPTATAFPAGNSCTVIQQLTLAAGTYMANLRWQAMDGANCKLQYYTNLLYVWQLGA